MRENRKGGRKRKGWKEKGTVTDIREEEDERERGRDECGRGREGSLLWVKVRLGRA